MTYKQLTLSVAFLLVCAASSTAQQTFKIEVKYDRFSDKTTVTLQPLEAIGFEPDALYIAASFSCPGNKHICQPEQIFFTIFVFSAEGEYKLPAKLVILADRERFALGNMKNFGSNKLVPESNITGTSFLIDIPRDTFLRIVSAERVQMRLDLTEFTLPAKLHAGLNSLAHYATP